MTEIPETECEALRSFYDSTGGDNWNNQAGWFDTYTPCNWYGIVCKNGQVSALNLYANNLDGMLPPELQYLPALEILWLYQNNLHGVIPPEIGSLFKLEQVWLSYNALTGNLPPEIGKLVNRHYRK